MMDTLTQKISAIEQHSRQAEEFVERYRVLEKDAYQSCFTYSRRRLDALLDKHLPISGSGARLLDVGCGTGNQMARYAQRGFEVAGVDGSAEMLAQARTLNPGLDIRQADVETIPFPDNSFDFALCIEVLRYLPNVLPCLREMARVLRPGGVCLVTATPLLNLNGYWIINRLANIIRIGNLVSLKQFFVTSRSLSGTAKAAGFSQVDLHGVYLGPINWIERLLPPALPWMLRHWEPIDAAVADRWWSREFSNMILMRAAKSAEKADAQ